jgi:DNA-binding XRE family transcriptional regulator
VSARSAEHAAFGRAVREAREQLGLSQEELGDRANVHRNYVGGVERGELNPTLATDSVGGLTSGASSLHLLWLCVSLCFEESEQLA